MKSKTESHPFDLILPKLNPATEGSFLSLLSLLFWANITVLLDPVQAVKREEIQNTLAFFPQKNVKCQSD